MSDPVKAIREQYRRRKGHEAANEVRLAGDPLAAAEVREDWKPVTDLQRFGPFIPVPDADDDEDRARERLRRKRRRHAR